jgi:hypothetical protein
MTTATVARRAYHRPDPLVMNLPEHLPKGMDLDTTGGEPESWRDAALCAQTDPNVFFPDKGRTNSNAKKLCMRCPVREACLAHALHNGEHYGIWGGKSARERARLVTALGLPHVPTPRYFPPMKRGPQADPRPDHETEPSTGAIA